MAYQKCDERLSVIDVELGVSYRGDKRCGRHGGRVRPTRTAISTRTWLYIYPGPSLCMIEADQPHFLGLCRRAVSKVHGGKTNLARGWDHSVCCLNANSFTVRIGLLQTLNPVCAQFIVFQN